MTIKKGQVINPYGNLPIGDDLKNARKLTRADFERTANKYMQMTWEMIDELIKQKNLPMMDYMIVSIMHRAVKDGDQKRLDFLLDRLIGQVVRRIRVQHEEEPIVKQIPMQVSDEERLEMLEKMRQRIIDAKAEQTIDAEFTEISNAKPR